MRIEQIKQFISEEYSKDNKEPYKELKRFVMSIYRNENKQKGLIKLYNDNYYKSKKSLKNNTNKEISKKSLNSMDIFS